jgi:hypothetical protein
MVEVSHLREQQIKHLTGLAATDAWTSSERLNLLTGKGYLINNASVLSATTLGSNVVNSSLTSVGTIGTGSVAGRCYRWSIWWYWSR